MTSINDHDRLVGFHYRQLAESDPTGYGNPHVIHALGERGIGAVLVPHKEAYDFEVSSTRVYETRTKLHEGQPTLEVAAAPREVALGGNQGGIEAVRARLLTPPEEERRLLVREINTHDPLMVDINKYPTDGVEQRHRLANLLDVVSRS